jgi:hypothetical protein
MMAVRVYCDSPGALLVQIKQQIRKGAIETWQLDKDEDLTHVPDQWRNKAWFTATTEENRLVFNILGQKSEKMSRVIYGVYHGRLIEMLLSHFDEQFTRASATALPTSDNKLGGSNA